jgi:hypothetical protein
MSEVLVAEGVPWKEANEIVENFLSGKLKFPFFEDMISRSSYSKKELYDALMNPYKKGD